MSKSEVGLFRRKQHTPLCVEVHQIGEEARWIAWVEKSYTESGHRKRNYKGLAHSSNGSTTDVFFPGKHPLVPKVREWKGLHSVVQGVK